jgi:hypothetical protein
MHPLEPCTECDICTEYSKNNDGGNRSSCQTGGLYSIHLGMSLQPLTPIYPFEEPGKAITIHLGTTEVAGVGRGPGRVWAVMDGSLDINWEVDTDGSVDLGDVTLRLRRPEIGDVDVEALVSNTSGRGWINNASLSSGRELTRVVVHWVNLPSIWPAEVLHGEGRVWAGRWTAQGAGWRMTFDSRPDIRQALAALKQPSKFGITHVAELQRVDGSSFDPETAANALFGWQVALSLAMGRWVAPAFPVGFDADGSRVWEQWAPWRCNGTAGYPSWWDDQNGDDLRDFVRRFMEIWVDPDRYDFIRYFSSHLIAGNQVATTPEARIMLVQAGLEYLSWVKYVIVGGRSRTAHKSGSAVDHLTELLDTAPISTQIPAELPALAQFVVDKGLTNGPEVVTRVRNRLIHPKDAGEPYRIGNLVFEAWLLLMHYADLLLLYELGYAGRYVRRYSITSNRWAHDRHPVPWT